MKILKSKKNYHPFNLVIGNLKKDKFYYLSSKSKKWRRVEGFKGMENILIHQKSERLEKFYKKFKNLKKLPKLPKNTK